MLAAGCSGGVGTSLLDVATTPAPSSSEPANRPEGAAPEVPEPLDVDELLDDPCEALATEQLDRIGVAEPGKMELDGDDAECRWHLTTSELHVVSLSPVESKRAGLSDVYGGKQFNAYFEPTEIDGYPAVYTSALDQRSSGNCELWVGVTDELAVDITTNFLETEPCPVAEQLATAMIEHARA
jgi:hypothetical protein